MVTILPKPFLKLYRKVMKVSDDMVDEIQMKTCLVVWHDE